MNVKKSVRALLCLYLTLIIATDAVKGQSLKVGDTLPPELWSMPLDVINHPEGKGCITLNDYKDKLIILDFWATWCAPCIKSLTKLDTLQKEFGEQLAIIPITYENADKVLPFLTKRGYQLPSIINDSTLKKYFPHRSIPHQVWVRAGEVLAVTGAEYATRSNIIKILADQNMKILMKEDVMDMSDVVSQTPYYQSTFSPRIRNYTSEIRRGTDNIEAYNVSLKSLIQEAYGSDFSRSQINAFMVWEVSDSLKQVLTAEGKGLQGDYYKDSLYNQWLDQTLFCYSLRVSSDLKPTVQLLREIMKRDIGNFMGLMRGVSVSVQARAKEHLVLTKEKFDFPSQESGYPATQIVKILSYEWDTPVIKHKSLADSICLNIDLTLTDRSTIERQLSNQGFSLKPTLLETRALVISELKSLKP